MSCACTTCAYGEYQSTAEVGSWKKTAQNKENEERKLKAPLSQRLTLIAFFLLFGAAGNISWRSIAFAMSYWMDRYAALPIIWPLLLLAYNTPGLPVMILQLRFDAIIQQRVGDFRYLFWRGIACFVALMAALVVLPLTQSYDNREASPQLFSTAVILIISVCIIGVGQSAVFGWTLQMATLFPTQRGFKPFGATLAGGGVASFVMMGAEIFTAMAGNSSSVLLRNVVYYGIAFFVVLMGTIGWLCLFYFSDLSVFLPMNLNCTTVAVSVDEMGEMKIAPLPWADADQEDEEAVSSPAESCCSLIDQTSYRSSAERSLQGRCSSPSCDDFENSTHRKRAEPPSPRPSCLCAKTDATECRCVVSNSADCAYSVVVNFDLPEEMDRAIGLPQVLMEREEDEAAEGGETGSCCCSSGGGYDEEEDMMTLQDNDNDESFHDSHHQAIFITPSAQKSALRIAQACAFASGIFLVVMSGFLPYVALPAQPIVSATEADEEREGSTSSIRTDLMFAQAVALFVGNELSIILPQFITSMKVLAGFMILRGSSLVLFLFYPFSRWKNDLVAMAIVILQSVTASYLNSVTYALAARTATTPLSADDHSFVAVPVVGHVAETARNDRDREPHALQQRGMNATRNLNFTIFAGYFVGMTLCFLFPLLY